MRRNEHQKCNSQDNERLCSSRTGDWFVYILKSVAAGDKIFERGAVQIQIPRCIHGSFESSESNKIIFKINIMQIADFFSNQGPDHLARVYFTIKTGLLDMIPYLKDILLVY